MVHRAKAAPIRNSVVLSFAYGDNTECAAAVLAIFSTPLPKAFSIDCGDGIEFDPCAAERKWVAKGTWS
jgi:hypothetical protein